MKPWLRNALTFGVISAVVTLLLNWLGNATASGDGCHRSSPLSLLAFLVFVVLMALAGFMTTRAGDTVGMATISGLVAALISAVGTVVAIAVIFGSITASCLNSVNNDTGISTSAVMGAVGIGAASFISLIGLGIGAGMGAIGGAIGRRPSA